MFLYREVLAKDVGVVEHVIRARVPVKVPVVLSVEEARAVMAHMKGVSWLVVALLDTSSAATNDAVKSRPCNEVQALRRCGPVVFRCDRFAAKHRSRSHSRRGSDSRPRCYDGAFTEMRVDVVQVDGCVWLRKRVGGLLQETSIPTEKRRLESF